jgi:hypothetical protein
MSNKTELKKNLKQDETKSTKSGVNQIGEEAEKTTPLDKVAEKKSSKKSSALVAASLGRSAVDHAKPHSSGDVSGSSGLSNTGPFVSYEEE